MKFRLSALMASGGENRCLMKIWSSSNIAPSNRIERHRRITLYVPNFATKLIFSPLGWVLTQCSSPGVSNFHVYAGHMLHWEVLCGPHMYRREYCRNPPPPQLFSNAVRTNFERHRRNFSKSILLIVADH
jgi:hypothetical protein